MFAFTTYSDTISQREWEALGVVGYEEVEDPHKLKFVIINTLKPKRTKQIKEILDSLNIKLHKLTTEPDDITSFTKKETSQESIFYKMIHGKRDSDTYKSWKVPKGLETELNCNVKAHGKRKRAPVDRFKIDGDRPRPIVTGAAFLSANYDTEPESPCESSVQISFAQPVLNVQPVVQVEPEVQPVVQVDPDAQPIVQAVWIPSSETTNLEAEIDKLRSILAERNRLVEAQAKHLADKDKMIAEKSRQINSLVSAFRGI